MLLEQLVEKAEKDREYDWDAYYRWFFSQLSDQKTATGRFWLCPKCLSVNFVDTEATYGKCRGCRTIHPTFGAGSAKKDSGRSKEG